MPIYCIWLQVYFWKLSMHASSEDPSLGCILMIMINFKVSFVNYDVTLFIVLKRFEI